MKVLMYPLFCTLLFFGGCPENTGEPDSVIRINNYSNDDIVFFFQYNSRYDTLLSTFPFPLNAENAKERTILINGTDSIPGTYKRTLKNNPDKVLMLFLFSHDVILNESWDKITNGYLILKRYDLTLDSLESRNWIIDYP